jgi:hypothetical protein
MPQRHFQLPVELPSVFWYSSNTWLHTLDPPIVTLHSHTNNICAQREPPQPALKAQPQPQNHKYSRHGSRPQQLQSWHHQYSHNHKTRTKSTGFPIRMRPLRRRKLRSSKHHQSRSHLRRRRKLRSAMGCAYDPRSESQRVLPPSLLG